MHVVAAGVHYWFFFTRGRVFCGYFRRVGESCEFGDGEGVHVGAEEDCLSRAVLEDCCEAVAADSGVEGVAAEGGEVGGYFKGGVEFLGGEFGVGVEVFVDVFVGGEVYGCGLNDFGGCWLGHFGRLVGWMFLNDTGQCPSWHCFDLRD